MTEHSPITLIAAPTFTDWDGQRGEHDRLHAELRPANKAVVFDALTAAGLATVTVRFDGLATADRSRTSKPRPATRSLPCRLAMSDRHRLGPH
jgi:hypothetical protein